MNGHEEAVARHYGRSDLLVRIRAGLSALGHDPDRLSPDDLKPVDEFHIGGAEATADLVGQLEIDVNTDLLDIGCGIGGTARLVAARHGCRVTGIDLTPEYVDCARALSAAAGLGQTVSFEEASATELPFADHSFDVATLIHVGMNVSDKAALMREARRVLRNGGTFAVYEVMRTGPGELDYPVPWAVTPETSFVDTPEGYVKAAGGAGLTVASRRERRDFALDYFDRMKADMQGRSGPPPIGLHLLMGESAPVKIGNMIANIEAGRIAPVELVLSKPR